MGYIAKFKHGAKEIDLASDPYQLTEGFAPSSVNINSLVSSGSLSNKYAGGQRVERQFKDRTFSVDLNITGASVAETHFAIRRLIAFLEFAILDDNDKTYFVFNPSDAVPYDPQWGQNHYYYEIKDATEAIDRLRIYLTVNDNFIAVSMPLLVAPTATGLLQLVGSATGGILEHTWATEDGLSRGTVIPPATINLVDNPIFMHSTWNTEWTDGANLTDTENTDPEYVMFGRASAKLTAVDSVNNNYTQSVTCSATTDHAFSGYVKLQDGGAVTSSNVVMYYTETLTTTYTAVGDGWYRLTATHAGVAAATNFSFFVIDGNTIYLDGVQVEAGAYATPLAYGDLLDVAWGGTAHAAASTSTRTASRLRVPWSDIGDITGMTFRIAWLADADSDDLTQFSRFLEDDNGNLMLSISNTTPQELRIEDGTNAQNTTGDDGDFVAGDIMVLHWTIEQDGMTLYKDGTSVATSTYTVPASPSYIYIGSSNVPSLHVGGTFLDVTTWKRVLSATEVANDYANIADHLTGGDTYGQRLNAVPWFWTNDGDDTLDNGYDSTYENFMVVGGIPGDIDAHTIINQTVNFLSEDPIHWNLVKMQQNDYHDITEWCYFDLSGTVDANAVGGEVERNSVGTAVSVTLTGSVALLAQQIIDGKYVQKFFARTKDASATTVNMRMYYKTGGNVTLILPDYEVKNTTTSFDIQEFDGLFVPDPENIITGMRTTPTSTSTITLQVIRDSATANLDVDYLYVAYDKLLKIINHNSSGNSMFYDSSVKKAITMGSGNLNTATHYAETPYLEGDRIEFSPNILNVFIQLVGEEGDSADKDEYSVYKLYVNPRWLLT